MSEIESVVQLVNKLRESQNEVIRLTRQRAKTMAFGGYALAAVLGAGWFGAVRSQPTPVPDAGADFTNQGENTKVVGSDTSTDFSMVAPGAGEGGQESREDYVSRMALAPNTTRAVGSPRLMGRSEGREESLPYQRTLESVDLLTSRQLNAHNRTSQPTIVRGVSGARESFKIAPPIKTIKGPEIRLMVPGKNQETDRNGRIANETPGTSARTDAEQDFITIVIDHNTRADLRLDLIALRAERDRLSSAPADRARLGEVEAEIAAIEEELATGEREQCGTSLLRARADGKVPPADRRRARVTE